MLLMAFLVIGIGLVNAQISKVTGHVTSDEDGLPVVGASRINDNKRAKFGENFGYFVHRLPHSGGSCQITSKCCFEV